MRQYNIISGFCPERRVESAWIDYNGHMNMAYYHVLFDQALDHVFDDLGVGAAYVASGAGSCFTAEVHVAYLDELSEADPVRVSYQLLDWDEKRLHLFAEMHHATAGYLAATSEQLARSSMCCGSRAVSVSLFSRHMTW